MKWKHKVYRTLSKIFPHPYHVHINKLLIYGGESKYDGFYWIGSGVVLGLLVFLGIFLYPFATEGTITVLYALLGIVGFIFIQVINYLLIFMKMEDRTRRVEKVLPDMLQLVAANVRSGMTPYHALKLAARKEFGPLKDEIEYATTRAMGTENFGTILLTMNTRIRSEMLDRALKLFITAMRSGGNLAQLLEDISRDLTETRSLKKELTTNTKTYTMFILFTVVIGTPLLLAISIYFLDIVTAMQANTSSVIQSFETIGSLAGTISITTSFLVKISIVMLILTSLLASVLMGVIKEGNYTYGLKYALPIIAVSLGIFFVMKYIFTHIVGRPF